GRERPENPAKDDCIPRSPARYRGRLPVASRLRPSRSDPHRRSLKPSRRGDVIMAAVQETVDRVRAIDVDAYKYGFVTDIESDKAPKGLDESTVRFISAKKGEPEWLLEWRQEALRRWFTMDAPKWARVEYPEIDFQDL